MMPTNDQGQELIDNTTSEWVTINEVKGRKFTNKTDTSKYIFLPAGGLWGEFGGTSFTMVGSYGFSWCTTIGTSNTLFGCYLRLSSNEFNIDSYYRECGFTIRAVRPW